MEVKGYKAFNNDKTNRYGIPFEEGKTYTVNEQVSFGNNGHGFHMCANLADVFRYFHYEDDEVCVAEVTGKGTIVKYDDEYYGYYDMYAVSSITIDRFLSRKEIIARMLKDQEFNNQKFLMTFNLNEQEKTCFLKKYRHNEYMLKWILYYQFDCKNLYSIPCEERAEQIRMVLNNGQDNNKRSS